MTEQHAKLTCFPNNHKQIIRRPWFCWVNYWLFSANLSNWMCQKTVECQGNCWTEDRNGISWCDSQEASIHTTIFLELVQFFPIFSSIVQATDTLICRHRNTVLASQLCQHFASFSWSEFKTLFANNLSRRTKEKQRWAEERSLGIQS